MALFIDDRHIESAEGAVRGVQEANRVTPTPLLTCDEPWETWALSTYINVMYDDEEELFKMWCTCAALSSTSPSEK